MKQKNVFQKNIGRIKFLNHPALSALPAKQKLETLA
jgi:hypothetical protein